MIHPSITQHCDLWLNFGSQLNSILGKENCHTNRKSNLMTLDIPWTLSQCAVFEEMHKSRQKY